MMRRHPLLAPFLALTLAACGGATGGPSIAEPEPDPAGAPPAESPSPQAPTGTPRTPTKTGDLGTPQNVAVPFQLIASNQSFDMDPVDFDLFIDGKQVVTGDFLVGSQHTFLPFDFSIATGEHTLRAVSKKGNTEATATFKVNATQRWAVVLFWYSDGVGGEPEPAHFSIDLHDEAPRFS